MAILPLVMAPQALPPAANRLADIKLLKAGNP